MIELSIIIVNYKTPKILSECLDSIFRNKGISDIEVIVVDNCSNDSSQELICDNFPKVIWIQNDSNLGFGIANNIGINRSKGKYTMLLNSDTIITDNKTIPSIINKLKKEPISFGMATCQLKNKDNTNQKSTYFYNASFVELFSENIIIDYVFKFSKNKNSQIRIHALKGACLLFEKDKLSELGYFDPEFFLYSEEFEWCYRIRKSGLDLKIYRDLQILHLEEASSTSKVWNTKQRYLSLALLFRKVHTPFGLFLYFFIHLFNTISNFLMLWKFDRAFRKSFGRKQKLFWGLAPEYLRILLFLNNKPVKVKN